LKLGLRASERLAPLRRDATDFLPICRKATLPQIALSRASVDLIKVRSFCNFAWAEDGESREDVWAGGVRQDKVGEQAEQKVI
jgi:hypothetical protein